MIDKRFTDRLVRQGDCLLWTGAILKNGYGYLGRGRRGREQWYAHRYSWYLAHGPIPPKAMVLHLCRSKNCVSLAHLYLGDARQNALDRQRDGTWKNPGPYVGNAYCKHGHKYTPETTIYEGNARSCRVCANLKSMAHYRKRRLVGAVWGVVAYWQAKAA